MVGAAALLLASKVEELMPPLVSDFVYVCDDAYTRDTILAMERKMLKVIRGLTSMMRRREGHWFDSPFELKRLFIAAF